VIEKNEKSMKEKRFLLTNVLFVLESEYRFCGPKSGFLNLPGLQLRVQVTKWQATFSFDNFFPPFHSPFSLEKLNKLDKSQPVL
jgi:hypothetical protein